MSKEITACGNDEIGKQISSSYKSIFVRRCIF